MFKRLVNMFTGFFLLLSTEKENNVIILGFAASKKLIIKNF